MEGLNNKIQGCILRRSGRSTMIKKSCLICYCIRIVRFTDLLPPQLGVAVHNSSPHLAKRIQSLKQQDKAQPWVVFSEEEEEEKEGSSCGGTSVTRIGMENSREDADLATV